MFDLEDQGVALVGELPAGFPPFTFPAVPLGDLGLLFAGALGISLVSLTDTISTASVFADKTGAEIDGNREMVGVGAASIAAGFFQGFPVSTSGSRTAVAFQSGARTQVTGLVGAAAIVALLLSHPACSATSPSQRSQQSSSQHPSPSPTSPDSAVFDDNAARTSCSPSSHSSASPCSACCPGSPWPSACPS